MKNKLEEMIPKFYGAVVVGERGQIVIPAEARRDMQINPGEKLIILGDPQENGLLITKVGPVLQLMSRFREHMSHLESAIKTDAEPPK